MSKKKKFAGKKTKLAKHALTQALTARNPASPPPESAPAPAATLVQALQALRHEELTTSHLDLDEPRLPTQEQLQMAQAYLQLLEELSDIRDCLRAPGQPPRPRRRLEGLWQTITPEILRYAVQLVADTLRALRPLVE